MKLAIVVQRYGADINGGAEQHARYIAERLARHATGRGPHHLRARLRHLEERAAGRRRADQRRHRSPIPCLARTAPARVRPAIGRSLRPRALARRRAALARQRGAGQPGAREIRRGRRRPSTTSCCSSAIATITRGTWRAASPSKAILVPTAERDPAIGLGIFGPVFRGVRGADVQLARKSGR